MKRAASILSILLVLASAAGITVDRHYCGGRVVDVRLAIDDRNATCGMEQDGMVCAHTPAFRQNCCHNVMSKFSVNDYSIASLLTIDKPGSSVIHILYEAPEVNIFNSFSAPVNIRDTGPPGLDLLCARSAEHTLHFPYLIFQSVQIAVPVVRRCAVSLFYYYPLI